MKQNAKRGVLVFALTLIMGLVVVGCSLFNPIKGETYKYTSPTNSNYYCKIYFGSSDTAYLTIYNGNTSSDSGNYSVSGSTVTIKADGGDWVGSTSDSWETITFTSPSYISGWTFTRQ